MVIDTNYKFNLYMENMEKDVATYVRKHTFMVTLVVVVVFVVLALGEYFLYRKIMLVNKMVSEGLMQIKETDKQSGDDLDSMIEDLGVVEKESQ